MRTAVDTNVLFDLLTGDANAVSAARQALASALSAGPAVICPVVFTELAAGFDGSDEVIRFTQDLQLHLDAFSADALLLAGAAWRRYVKGRGGEFRCPSCGHKAGFRCPACQTTVTWRQHIIADFLVGGHASGQADCLLTRDVRYYRAYFPDLHLVVP
ncbi:MAG: nucleotide-binding protein [Chloroflexi bacterium]|nr:nucleotide-binding protein [Chloroflexota bacterium]